MKPKVSIIIPVYNVGSYLARCLDSVINQTYRNIEIVIINDGSKDESLSICKYYCGIDPRIKLITQNNKGLSGARNTGIDNASGDYICFVDSDDWIERDYVSFAIDIINRTNVSLVVLGYYNSDDLGSRIVNKGWLDKKETVFAHDEALYLLVEDQQIKSHAWDKVYHRNLFNTIRFPDGKNYEDLFIMHVIFDACSEIAISKQPKYHYYNREDSIARNYKTKNILDYFEAEFQRRSYMEVMHPELVALQNTKLMELLLSYYPKFGKSMSDSKVKYAKEYLIFKKYIEKIQMFYSYKHENFTVNKYNVMYKAFSLHKLTYKFISPIANAFISRIKRSKHKFAIKIILYKSKDFVRILGSAAKKKKYILIGIPEYDNLGDVAIGYAEQLFMRNNLPDGYELLVISENNFSKYIRRIKKAVNREDVIFIQGGGNFGNQYFDQEQLRRKIIISFPNRIILMPSTFFMSSMEKTAKKYAAFYNKANITIFVREQYSYNYMKRYFSNKIFLVPDIVLSLENLTPSCELRSGIGVCLRNDIESKISTSEKTKIKDSLFKIADTISVFDTCINMPVTEDRQDEALHACWKDISRYKLVVTDKLHTLIFCVLTRTPCIALSNYNYKIKGTYTWFKDLDYVAYLDDFEQIEVLAQKFIREENFTLYPDLRDKFIPLVLEVRGKIQ